MPLETNVPLSGRLRSYLEAWTSLDPTAVAEAYTQTGTHRGPGVVKLAPEQADATLNGPTEIHRFVASISPLFTSLTYLVRWTLEDGDVSVVEYEFVVPGSARPGLVAEIIDWDEDRAQSVRGYVLAPPP